MQLDNSQEMSGYAICTTARSGGNYLCQLLTSTDALGRPQEYFNVAGWRQNGIADYPDNSDAQVAWILRHGATSNGIYGLKIVPYQFDEKRAFPWPERLPNLKFVYLWRRDVLAQAVSLSRAVQTGQWHASQLARTSARFDRAGIAYWLRKTVQDDARWRSFFARNGIVPLSVIYEAMADAPQSAVDAIAVHLGILTPVPIDWSKVTLSIQRNVESDGWQKRFVRESENLATLDSIEIAAVATLLRLPRMILRKFNGR